MNRKISPRFGVIVCLFLLMVGGALGQSIAELTSQGNVAQTGGHYDEAITIWNTLLEKNPKNGAAYRARGACYFHKNDFEKAIADFSQAIELNKNDAGAYSGRGDSYFSKHDLDNAVSDFKRAIQLSPRSIAFYQHIIDVYWAKEDWDNVITNATKVIELSPGDDAYARYVRGWRSNTRGEAWQYKGDLDKALEDFNAAIQLSPSWDAPLANRGQIKLKKGDIQGALADLDEAVRQNPRNAENYRIRGEIYGDRKDWDSDIKNWSEAIQNNPTNINFLWNRASIYRVRKKDFDRAVADYNKAVELDPQYPGVYTVRGYAYQRQNLPDKAIVDFAKVVEMEPTNRTAYFRRAEAYYEAGKYKETRGDFEEFIRMNPTNSFGYLELAWHLATCPDASFRNGKEALELAQKGCALEKDQDACAFYLAAAFAEVGDFDEAVRNEKQAMRYSKQWAGKNGIQRSAKTEAREKEYLQLFEQHKPYHGVLKLSDLDD